MDSKFNLKESNNIMTRNHNQSILDEDVPNIGVGPLKPTLTGYIKKYAKKNCRLILNLKPKTLLRSLPLKILDMILYSKSVTYKNPIQPSYWQINIPTTDENEIEETIKQEREKHKEEEKYCKYIKQYCYNNIDSSDKIHECLDKTFQKESNAFKINIAFGYVTEKEHKIHLFKPGKQLFLENLQTIANEQNLCHLKNQITAESVIQRLTQQFPDSQTRLLGIYAMDVKIIRLDFPIGSEVKLPDYIKSSNFIVGLESVKNNMCFWACMALVDGCRRDRYTAAANKLFENFYGFAVDADAVWPGGDLVGQIAQDGIVLKKVSQSLGIGEIVNCDEFNVGIVE